MNTTLFRPLPLPPEGVRPGVGLLVLAFHLVLLWMANLYWPLNTVLLGAVQSTVQTVAVQIFQKATERSEPGDSDAVSAKQAITSTSRQRLGRAEAMLALPPAQTDSSTPLAGTAQSVQTAPVRPALAAQPTPEASTAAAAVTPPAAQARPATVAEAPIATAPKQVTQPVVRSVDEALPAPAPIKPAANTPPPPSATAAPLPASPSLPASPALLASPSVPLTPPFTPPLPAAASTPPAPPASVVPVAPASVEAAPAISPSTPAPAAPALTSNAPIATSSSSTGTASGPAQAPGVGTSTAGSPQGNTTAPAASSAPSANAGAPLNLNLPPRYIYRPPISLPRRSLADMANEQLRRKPRDAFAEGMESAGNIDCLKDAPDGAAQGLLAIGPLLKRAMDEKCRK